MPPADGPLVRGKAGSPCSLDALVEFRPEALACLADDQVGVVPLVVASEDAQVIGEESAEGPVFLSQPSGVHLGLRGDPVGEVTIDQSAEVIPQRGGNPGTYRYPEKCESEAENHSVGHLGSRHIGNSTAPKIWN